MDFTGFIDQHAPGKSEAGRLLGKLVDAVRDTGKPGTLTFVVKIEPDKAQPNTGLLISDEVTAKLPKHERPVRKAWMLPSGAVVDYDPDAPPMPGMAVDEAGKLVDLSAEELASSAAHFLQHTTGVVTSVEFGKLQAVPDPVATDDPGEETAHEPDPPASEEEVSFDEAPGPDEFTHHEPAPVDEEEGVPDFDPANPFSLASTAAPARSAGLTDPPEKKARAPRAPRKVKDQPQA